MKKNSLIFLIVLAVFIGAYTAYNIRLKKLSDFDTQLAVMATEYNTVNADCFVVRDENHKSGKKNLSIVKNSDKGVYIPYVEDGSRVAAGDIIALFFSSEDDAKAYREKQLLTETLDYFQKLQNQSALSTLDIDKLEKTINDNILLLVEMCEKNDFSDSDEIIASLKYDISAKKIAVGETVDFSGQIESVESQIKKISKRAENYKAIRAEFPGCFISSVDGYETSVQYEDVASFDKNATEKLINSEPSKVSSSSIGKIIDRYNWYALCNVPKDSLEKITVGKKVRVTFENTDVSYIEMKVETVSPVTDGYASVVLSSNLMNSDIALLRKEKIRIFTDECEGLKVPREAVRSAENPESNNPADISNDKGLGVYIVYGQLIKFRKIDVIYYGDDFVIAKRDTENSDSLKLYDKIITKGRNIYDGKLIG